eukprot:TRINITY_DN6796_c0_g1_i1.p2 TRINITY_DN6796_c0_g1~~TRINITY_DN6796_c0_g1_i1.p2  ORF type:complete len:294 (-),score=72.71 TRINITY_DN6796_c0_g1_i1:1276-2157(-)
MFKQTMSKLTEKLMNQIFGSILSLGVDEVKTTQENNIDKLQLKESLEDNQLSNVLEIITQVLSFLQIKLFNEKNVSVFGEILWEKLGPKIYELLKQEIPNDRTKLEQYREKLQPALLSFLAFIQKLGLVDDDKLDKLNTYFQDLDDIFINKKKISIISNARKMIVNMEDGTLTLDGNKSEDGLAVSLPNGKVNSRIIKLISLLGETLEEADISDSQQLFQCVRDILDIYVANISLNLNSNTQIVHNNTKYLAHHVFTWHHKYSRIRRPQQAKGIDFADLLPVMLDLSNDTQSN